MIVVSKQHEIVTEESHRCCSERADYSLYLFAPSNKFRQLLQKLVSSKSFDYYILVLIVFNCITLGMERPSISSTSLVSFHHP